VERLICRACGAAYGGDEPRWRCDCGGLLDVAFAPAFDLERIAARKPTMWRYAEAIPVGTAQVVTLDEGFTPLLRVPFDGVPVWLKLDQLFPTGSYKDRGASAMISKAAELGVREVVEDSSGNAGCAVAAYCARAGIACSIYVPADTSPGKLAQIRLYGARLVLVPGSRQDTADAAWEAAQHTYYASHSWNPYFFQGTKTWAYEVCEQLGWRAPDTVVLPAGNGTLLLGAYLGFADLHRAGVIARIPRIVGVQAARCAPLYRAYLAGEARHARVEAAPTLAEGIAIADPVRGPQILAAVRETGGRFLTVGEDEIARSLRDLCARGLYVEPTSAATTAGVLRYVREAIPGEVIVSTLTGHGLKSTEKMMKLGAHLP